MANAQDSASRPAQGSATDEQLERTDSEYNTLVKRALNEYDLGHWSEAKAFFLRAHQRKPSARTLRGLGLAAYELRSYVESLSYLRQALASRERPLTEDMRAEVKRTIDETKTFIAYVKLASDPHGASVRVDGQPAAFDDDGGLMLDPGEHELRLEAPGYEPLSHAVTARGGEHMELSLSLQRQSDLSVSLPPERSEAATSRARDLGFWESLTTQHKLGMIVAASGVAGVGVGIAFGILAINAKNAADGHCKNDLCDAEGFSDHKRAVSRADVASVGFIVGGALLVGGAVLYLTAKKRERSDAVSALRLAPIAGGGLAGASLGGAF